MAKVNIKQQMRIDMLDQLETKGAIGQHYVDKVDDYMKLYDLKNKLYADIKKRGVQCEYDNGGGQKGFKKNDSIAEYYKAITSMDNIIKLLGLQPPATKDFSDGDDDDTP